MRCPNCNAEVSESAFCENCGSRLIPEDVQPEQVDAVIAPIDQSSEGLDVFVTDPVGSQQDQTYGAYDATQPANAYDATQPAYGYDQSQQAYGYDQNQQAYGNDPNQQQPYSYDATQQQPYTYDATQQMPYGSGQADYQVPQGGPYAPPTGQSYGYAQPPMQEPSKAPFVLSIIALVLSILGLFPISIVLAIIALVMNSGQKKRGEVSTKQTPTTIMSVISLVFSVLMAIFTAIVGGAIWVAVMNGEFGSSSHSSSTSTVVTTSSSSSSKSSSAASSSAASSSKSASAASSSASAAASAASSSDAVGTWTIDSMEYGGETYTSEELAYLRELDMEVNLVINGDGTVDFEIFGVPESGTWADKGGGTIALTFAGDSTDVIISGDELTMVDGSDKLVFTRKS